MRWDSNSKVQKPQIGLHISELIKIKIYKIGGLEVNRHAPFSIKRHTLPTWGSCWWDPYHLKIIAHMLLLGYNKFLEVELKVQSV